MNSTFKWFNAVGPYNWNIQVKAAFYNAENNPVVILNTPNAPLTGIFDTSIFYIYIRK